MEDYCYQIYSNRLIHDTCITNDKSSSNYQLVFAYLTSARYILNKIIGNLHSNISNILVISLSLVVVGLIMNIILNFGVFVVSVGLLYFMVTCSSIMMINLVYQLFEESKNH